MRQNEDTLESLHSNILDLYKAAISLSKRKDFGYSTHFSIACLEECAKYMIVYCKNHIEDHVFRKRFQHLTKHRIASSFYYLMGQIELLYVVEIAAEKADTPQREILNNFSGLLSATIDRGHPTQAAMAILKILSDASENETEKMRVKFIENIEKLRTKSIYVDISDDTTVLSEPSNITKEEARYYIDFCRVSISVISFFRDTNMTGREFVNSLPPLTRKQVKREAKERMNKLIESVKNPPIPAAPSRG